MPTSSDVSEECHQYRTYFGDDATELQLCLRAPILLRTTAKHLPRKHVLLGGAGYFVGRER